MNGIIPAPARVLQIRPVQHNLDADGSVSYSGAVTLATGEQWIPVMVATHGSAHAGYVDSYVADSGWYNIWFVDAVPTGTIISVHGIAYRTE